MRLQQIVVQTKVIAIGLSLMGVVTAFAQETYQPIYSYGGVITNISWSFDSRVLSFQENKPLEDLGPVSREQNSWHKYELETQTLTTGSLWPQPYVLPQGLSTRSPEQPLMVEGGFTFVSPNNRFLVYAAERTSETPSGEYPLAIIDMEQATSTLLENIPFCCANLFWE